MSLTTFLPGIAATTASLLVGLLAWFTRRVLKNNRGAVLDALYWITGRFITRSTQRYVNARRYFHNCLQSSVSSHLPVPGRVGIGLNIDESFVNLTLDRGLVSSRTYTHMNILDAGSRLIIVGDPGSGKSTLVKRILRDECRLGTSRPAEARLPIIVRLSQFIPPALPLSAEEMTDWAISELRKQVAQVPGYKMEQLFESYSQRSGLMVLLDGLDEVSTPNFGNVARAVVSLDQRLSALGPRNVIVMTMRQSFYDQVGSHFIDSFAQILRVKSFTANEVYEFLTRWPFDRHARTHRINEIYGELAEHPNLRDMCTNPLVLAMYVANYESVEANDLPDTRTEFYSKIAHELLVARRSRQASSRTARSVLERQREHILGSIALANLLESEAPSNRISIDRAIETVKDILDSSSDEHAERSLNQIASETGLIVEEQSGESLRFIHLTFCEYLAAVECVKSSANAVSALIQKHAELQKRSTNERTRLLEAIPFACALITDRSSQRDAIAQVARTRDWELLGRCILETQRYDHPAWRTYERKEGEYLRNIPHDAWDRHWIARLQLFRSVLSDAKRISAFAGLGSPPDREFSLFFGELVGSSSERFYDLFQVFASEDAAAAFRFAEEAGFNVPLDRPELMIEACLSLPFVSIAIENSQRQADGDVWASVLAEASLRYRIVAKELESASSILTSPKVGLGGNLGRLGNHSDSLLSSVLRQASPLKGGFAKSPMLNVMQMAGAKAPRWLDFAIGWTLAALAVSLCCVGVIATLDQLRQNSPISVILVIAMIAGILFTISAVIGLGALPFTKMKMYDQILNISDPSENLFRAYGEGYSTISAPWAIFKHIFAMPFVRSAVLVNVVMQAIRAGVVIVDQHDKWAITRRRTFIMLTGYSGSNFVNKIIFSSWAVGCSWIYHEKREPAKDVVQARRARMSVGSELWTSRRVARASAK